VIEEASSEDGTVGTACVGGLATGEAVLEAPTALADRVLILNGARWERAPGSQDYQPCDEHLGCGPPPTDPCDGVYVAQLVSGFDAPQHSYQGVEACDGTWLVYLLDTSAGVCWGGSTPCASTGRYTFWKFDPLARKWGRVSATITGGCGRVRDDAPDFPTVLCDRLPSPR
jgi:hypothetical protein